MQHSPLNMADNVSSPNPQQQAGSGTNPFLEIFLFEIKYRLRRPDTYLYFLAFFALTFLAFANGNLPAQDKVHINAEIVLSKFFAIISFFMMVVSASIMGAPIYRDLEYGTHEYYLSYPITKNDYFWGRFLGSFLFVIIICSSLVWGSLLGVWAGPKLGWVSSARVGPNHLMNYLRPFFVFALPNLLLTSSIFFGLVAYARNIKIIYTGGVIFYLGYMTALFIFNTLVNKNLIYYFDPFGINPISMADYYLSADQKNNHPVSIHGLLLANRIIWTIVGLVILGLTWLRFSFIRFFSGRKDKKRNQEPTNALPGFLKKIPKVSTNFGKGFKRSTIFTLAKIELLSIIRDNYFKLILGTGTLFLGFIFWMGFAMRFGVRDFPRTVQFMDLYNKEFIFFIFIILLFYTGEAVHREKTTRFAIINDALPPADSIFYGSKLIALFCLAIILSTVPFLLGIGVQISRGFTHFNFQSYLAGCYALSLPLFLEMIMFCFLVHVLINNKFAGHAVGLMVWTAMVIADGTGYFDYKLLLYSFKPDYTFSDMDSVGPTILPLVWFNIYWLFCGGLLLVIAAIFYYRGVISSFGERIRLARHRFHGSHRIIAVALLIGFIGTGFYNYYNVSHLNAWLTRKEHSARAAEFEKKLKQYANDPLPALLNLRLFTDIFPDTRRMKAHAFATIMNRTSQPMRRLLFDGDRLSTYSIKYNGQEIPYSNVLIYPRARFSLFRPAMDTSMYRLYQFPSPLAPGDTALLEVNSSWDNIGFTNGYGGMQFLHNGTAFDGGLPEIGYDDDEELSNDITRKDFNLPPKRWDIIPQNDSAGRSQLMSSNLPGGLTSYDATISTSGNQKVISAGQLDSQWTSEGRNYFHFLINKPSYAPFAMISAQYAKIADTVRLSNGKAVGIGIYYQAGNDANIHRFMQGYKDGLAYYSKAIGPYPFNQFNMVESPVYTSEVATFPALQAFSERFAWNAFFEYPEQFDYCYFYAVYQLGHQWWQYQVAPNHTIGSFAIGEGLAKYGAFLMYEKKFGIDRMKNFLRGESSWYLNRHQYAFERENPLIIANRDWVWDTKAGIVLFGLKNLIGEDSLNSALHEFYDEFAYRNHGPFAGNNDLYRVLEKHVPDSMQYYLSDGWQKVTIYNNSMISVRMNPLSKKNEYTVHLKFNIGKSYRDSVGNDKPAEHMNDYIDLGIFAVGDDKKSRGPAIPLYLKKLKFSAGIHEVDIIVKGKPAFAGLDPYGILLDGNQDDNIKHFE